MERNSRRCYKRILRTIIQQQYMECTNLWQRSRRLPLTNRSRMGMACKRRWKLHLCRKQYCRWCSMVYNKYKWYRFKRSKDKAGKRLRTLRHERKRVWMVLRLVRQCKQQHRRHRRVFWFLPRAAWRLLEPRCFLLCRVFSVLPQTVLPQLLLRFPCCAFQF